MSSSCGLTEIVQESEAANDVYALLSRAKEECASEAEDVVMKHKGKPDMEAASSDVVTELLREYHGAEFTESEMENDPVGCISRILEDLRAGKDADEFIVMSAMFDRTAHQEEYLALLKPEDMKWLMMSGMPEAKCILLAGMRYSWRSWQEVFKDETTGEEKQVVRTEKLDSPVFERVRCNVEKMLEAVCLEGTVTHELMGIVWFLKHYAGYDCVEDLKKYKSKHIWQ